MSGSKLNELDVDSSDDEDFNAPEVSKISGVMKCLHPSCGEPRVSGPSASGYCSAHEGRRFSVMPGAKISMAALPSLLDKPSSSSHRKSQQSPPVVSARSTNARAFQSVSVPKSTAAPAPLPESSSPAAQVALPVDSTDFWSGINRRVAETKHFLGEMEKHKVTLTNNDKSFHAENGPAFEAYSEFVQTYGQDDVDCSDGSPYSGVDVSHPIIRKVSQITGVMTSMTELRKQLDKSLSTFGDSTTTLLAELEKAETWRHEYAEKKKRFQEKQKKYLALSNGKSKLPPAKLAKKDEKMATRFQELELDRFDLNAIYRQLDAGRQLACLEPLISALSSYADFFEKGQAILAPFASYRKKLQDEALVKLRQQEEVRTCAFEQARLQLEQRLALSVKRAAVVATAGTGVRDLDRDRNAAIVTAADAARMTMSGYLFYPEPKFSAVWVEVKRGALYVSRESGGAPLKLDLMLCTVKEERAFKVRFTFTVMSVTEKVVLQAPSQESMLLWMSVIQNSISRSLHSGGGENSSGVSKETEIEQEERRRREHTLSVIRSIPGNNECADCREASPEWTSINLGVMLCVGCSGIHRSLGTHVSKVRSVALDNLDRHTVAYLTSFGNTVASSVWEATLGKLKNSMLPKPSDGAQVREKWIRDKYVDCAFVKTLPDGAGDDRAKLQSTLVAALTDGDLPLITRCIAAGALRDPLSSTNRCALLYAATMHTGNGGNTVPLDMLILGGLTMHVSGDRDYYTPDDGGKSDTNVKGWSLVHVAAALPTPDAIDQLLTRGGGGKLSLSKDKDGQRPHDIAKKAWAPLLASQAAAKEAGTFDEGDYAPLDAAAVLAELTQAYEETKNKNARSKSKSSSDKTSSAKKNRTHSRRPSSQIPEDVVVTDFDDTGAGGGSSNLLTIPDGGTAEVSRVNALPSGLASSPASARSSAKASKSDKPAIPERSS